MNQKYYIYILRCSDNTLYTGITTDIKRRVKEHQSKKGAKYTKSHSVQMLEALWKTNSGRSVASKIEYKLKHLTKTDKENLIKDPESIISYFDDIDITVAELNI